MAGKFGLGMAAAAALGALVATAPAQAADNVKAGVLTCNVASGWGFIFGSSRDLKCTYSPGGGKFEHYSGNITKFGVDIGYTQGGVIVWAVLAPTSTPAPGSLAGSYAGGTAGASVGVGVAANALVGGMEKSFALQPLSLQGMQGVNVAAGIASMTLKYEP